MPASDGRKRCARLLDLREGAELLLQTPTATALNPVMVSIQQPAPNLNGTRTNAAKIARHHQAR